jgi:Family of unknown function (DUF6152)
MRTKLALMVGITGLAVVGWSAASWAHHAFAAEFDADKPVTFKGVITKMEWVNPHTWLHVDVKNDLTFPDGRKLFLGSSGTGAPYELTPGNADKNN